MIGVFHDGNCLWLRLLSVSMDPFLCQVLEDVLLNMREAYLLLHVRKNLGNSGFHAFIVVCNDNMDATVVACQLKTYILQQVS